MVQRMQNIPVLPDESRALHARRMARSSAAPCASTRTGGTRGTRRSLASPSTSYSTGSRLRTARWANAARCAKPLLTSLCGRTWRHSCELWQWHSGRCDDSLDVTTRPPMFSQHAGGGRRGHFPPPPGIAVAAAEQGREGAIAVATREAAPVARAASASVLRPLRCRSQRDPPPRPQAADGNSLAPAVSAISLADSAAGDDAQEAADGGADDGPCSMVDFLKARGPRSARLPVHAPSPVGCKNVIMPDLSFVLPPPPPPPGRHLAAVHQHGRPLSRCSRHPVRGCRPRRPLCRQPHARDRAGRRGGRGRRRGPAAPRGGCVCRRAVAAAGDGHRVPAGAAAPAV